MPYRHVISTCLATLVVVTAASGALAQPAPPTYVAQPAPPEPPLPSFAITISPVHLLVGPILELTGEFRVGRKIGLAVLAGAGSVKDKDSDVKVSVQEFGGSFRYYALGDFRHGMQVGGELVYVHASASDGFESAVASGGAVGPFLGYKITTNIGFTFDAQLGFQYAGIGAESSSGETKSESKIIPLLNLNIGWSF